MVNVAINRHLSWVTLWYTSNLSVEPTAHRGHCWLSVSFSVSSHDSTNYFWNKTSDYFFTLLCSKGWWNFEMSISFLFSIKTLAKNPQCLEINIVYKIWELNAGKCSSKNQFPGYSCISVGRKLKPVETKQLANI